MSRLNLVCRYYHKYLIQNRPKNRSLVRKGKLVAMTTISAHRSTRQRSEATPIKPSLPRNNGHMAGIHHGKQWQPITGHHTPVYQL